MSNIQKKSWMYENLRAHCIRGIVQNNSILSQRERSRNWAIHLGYIGGKPTYLHNPPPVPNMIDVLKGKTIKKNVNSGNLYSAISGKNQIKNPSMSSVFYNNDLIREISKYNGSSFPNVPL